MAPRYFASYKTPKRVIPFSTRKRAVGYGSTQLVRNPFSVSSVQPKIPDGKTFISSGSRVQAVNEIAFVGGQSTLELFFFPGFNNALLARDPANNIPLVNYPFASHGSFNDTGAQLDPNVGVSQWRVVSSGLKLNCVNNATANAGWWEAHRVNLPRLSTSFAMITPTGGTDGSKVSSSTAATGGFPHCQPNADFTISPSFVTGKLRDLSKMLFKLRVNSDDHEFQTLQDNAANPGRAFIDPTYDAICIRIHGTESTRIMAHVVSNQEIVWDEVSAMARSSTASMRDQRAAGQMSQQHNRTPVGAAQAEQTTATAVTPRRRKRPRASASRRLRSKSYYM